MLQAFDEMFACEPTEPDGKCCDDAMPAVDVEGNTYCAACNAGLCPKCHRLDGVAPSGLCIACHVAERKDQHP